MQEPPDKKPPILDYEPPRPPLVPLYRKILAGMLLVMGVTLAIAALFVPNASARANILLPAIMLIVVAVVIRFQHVRF